MFHLLRFQEKETKARHRRGPSRDGSRTRDVWRSGRRGVLKVQGAFAGAVEAAVTGVPERLRFSLWPDGFVWTGLSICNFIKDDI